MLYVVVSGCYGDHEIIGYFTNREDADKYCTVCDDDDCYVVPIKSLENERDLSQISLKYAHRIRFYFTDDEKWIMQDDQPDSYECYTTKDFRPNFISYGSYWMVFNVQTSNSDRKQAEKIAQDCFAELLASGNGRIYEKDINLMNEKFAVPLKDEVSK